MSRDCSWHPTAPDSTPSLPWYLADRRLWPDTPSGHRITGVTYWMVGAIRIRHEASLHMSAASVSVGRSGTDMRVHMCGVQM